MEWLLPTRWAGPFPSFCYLVISAATSGFFISDSGSFRPKRSVSALSARMIRHPGLNWPVSKMTTSIIKPFI